MEAGVKELYGRDAKLRRAPESDEELHVGYKARNAGLTVELVQERAG